MKTGEISALGLIILAAVAGGGIPPFAKIALEQIPPFTFTFFRFILAGLVLGFVFLSKKEKLNLKKLIKVILVSLLATSNVTFFALGVRRTTATTAQMLYAAVPIIASILTYFILKQKISRKKIWGVLIGFVGVLVIILLPVIGKQSVFSGDLLGNLLVFTAVVSYSLYTVLSKKLLENFSPLTLTITFIITTIFIQAFLVSTELKTIPTKALSINAFFGIFYVGILGTAFYYIIYQQAIKKASPVVASMTLYLQPIFTFIWAFFLLGERLTLGFIAGATLAFLGAGIVTSKK